MQYGRLRESPQGFWNVSLSLLLRVLYYTLRQVFEADGAALFTYIQQPVDNK